MDLNIVQEIDNLVKINNIIVSVSDKTGLAELAEAILKNNSKAVFYSTGGTYDYLAALDFSVKGKNLVLVSDYIKQPEMQGGLVKTLDFKIYTGILSETYNTIHKADIEKTGSVIFDMVVVNLYPFKKTAEANLHAPEKARTNIDIGGPCMLRASAKNYIRTAAMCDPADYGKISQELDTEKGMLTLETRWKLAVKAFSKTAEYDSFIYNYFSNLEFETISKSYTINNQDFK